MSLIKLANQGINNCLKNMNLELVKIDSTVDTKSFEIINTKQLPAGASEYLQLDNQRLKNLQARYSLFNKDVTTPLVWTKSCISARELIYFRGDNVYVWQRRGPNMQFASYVLTTYYVKSIDSLNLMDKLKEDGLFGVYTINIADKWVSRDLLDSITEIYFLEKNLNISTSRNLKIIDIGAGYGRLAYRMSEAFPNLGKYYCTDAVPVSTFLSEYYLQFRNCNEKCKVVPLDEIDDTMKSEHIDLAINIHSFPECKKTAIDWWLSMLNRYNVSYLMIVPNSNELRTNDGIDFSDTLAKWNYHLIAKESKFNDPAVQSFAINPSVHYLFKLIRS